MRIIGRLWLLGSKAFSERASCTGFSRAIIKEDTYVAGTFLREQCGALVQSLEHFRHDFASALPSAAFDRIDQFLGTRIVQAAKDAKAEQIGAARGALVALAAFEAEITYLLAGRQEQIRARAERALLHLQRILAVDAEVSVKWANAFKDGETACERLGAVHFLYHGIWIRMSEDVPDPSSLTIPANIPTFLRSWLMP